MDIDIENNNEIEKTADSIYCYPGTNVLINKLDIKDRAKLEELENALIVFKIYELRKKGITGQFDLEHLLAIHYYLLSDLYEFAGKLRTENVAKDTFKFADARYIEQELKILLDKLKEEEYLKDKSKEELSERLAYYLAELNVLHPFREGNGRVTREFIRQLALKNGYLLDLRNVEFQEILDASIKSIVDTRPLEDLIFKCLVKEDKENSNK